MARTTETRSRDFITLLGMVKVTIELTDESAERLQARAAAEGVSVEQFAMREVERATSDPFEFVGMGAADVSATDIDELLRSGFATK